MILRIFATDGYTPESLFRWSVDETAEHLCEQQMLWVTRLDSPWRKLVDWFLKHKSCRGVILDPADRWEWNLEHEVTWRLAQGLYFGAETTEAVCWIHDDMAPPECRGFKGWLREWLASDSPAMAAPCYQLWNSSLEADTGNAPLVLDQVRADKVGVDFAADLHCWLARWNAKPTWLGPKITNTWPEGPVPTFLPANATSWRTSPYPFRHAKGVDRGFREHRGFVRRGFPTDRWKNADSVRCVPYDPEATWEEFKRKVGT